MESLGGLSDYQPKSADGKVILPAVISLFNDMQSRMTKMFEDLRSEFLKVCTERDQKIQKMDAEIVGLKKKVSALEAKIDDADAYERSDTAIISGNSLPVVIPDERGPELVCSLLKDKLNLVIAPTDISVAHRLGEKKASQGPDRRPLIVKFCRRNTKNDVVVAARKGKSPNFFINESLTPLRQSIAFVLRKARREFPTIISGASTIDGKNYVWLHPPSPANVNAKCTRHLIATHDRLVDLCEKTLGKPLNHFISNWSH